MSELGRGPRFIVRTVSGYTSIKVNNTKQKEGLSAYVIDRSCQADMTRSTVAAFRSEDFMRDTWYQRRGVDGARRAAEELAARLNERHGPWPLADADDPRCIARRREGARSWRCDRSAGHSGAHRNESGDRTWWGWPEYARAS